LKSAWLALAATTIASSARTLLTMPRSAAAGRADHEVDLARAQHRLQRVDEATTVRSVTSGAS
jgi:hypothetical protein